MKLEYLHDMTANGKFTNVVSENLIRLWDFGPKESKQFQDVIRDFVHCEQKQQLALHEQDFIEPINCKLTLRKDAKNNGIERLNEDEFICNLNEEAYAHMTDLVEPFVIEDFAGYQWLDELADAGDIDFLFLSGGTW